MESSAKEEVKRMTMSEAMTGAPPEVREKFEEAVRQLAIYCVNEMIRG